MSPLVREIMERLGPFRPPFDEQASRRYDYSMLERRPSTKLPTGAIYLGDWHINTGLRHGFGRLIWPDGSLYEGEWISDQASGIGRLIHSDGDVYEGSWI